MPISKEEFGKKYPLKCLRCSMQWGFDLPRDIQNFNSFTVADILCPGCGAISVPVGADYNYHKETI